MTTSTQNKEKKKEKKSNTQFIWYNISRWFHSIYASFYSLSQTETLDVNEKNS